MIPLTIDPALRGHVVLAAFQAVGVEPAGKSAALEEALDSLAARIRNRYASPAQAHDLFQPARQLYRALGLDPTKNRPSSEALLRRVITGRSLYRINRVVDTCNLVAMEIALPIGLYDNEHVQWPVELRRGEEGEGYRGLGKDHVNVAGRYTLADREGPFGNPSSDSFRTRIRETTRDCTFVLFAPTIYPLPRLVEQLEQTAQRVTDLCGGEVREQSVVH